MNTLLISVGLLVSAYAAEVKDFAGQWLLDNSTDTAQIIIKEDGEFFHSRKGRGDLKKENAKRYTITFYAQGSGQYYQCAVVIDRLVNGEAQVQQLTNPNLGSECDWGRMTRIDPERKKSLLTRMKEAIFGGGQK